MLYDSYEQVIRRDRPAYWYRPAEVNTSPGWRSVGRPGEQQLLTSPANGAYGGPGLPGAEAGRSSHTIGNAIITSGSAYTHGWSTPTFTVPGSTAVGWTYECWVMPTVAWTTNRPYMVFGRTSNSFTDFYGTPQEAEAFVFYNGQIIYVIRTGVTEMANGTIAWRVNDWSHLVGITRDGANQFWVNGRRIAGGTGSPDTANGFSGHASNPSSWRFSISQRLGWHSFPGYVAEPAFYDYALSPSQIQDHYRAGIMPRRSTSRLLSTMLPLTAAAPPPGGLTAITEGLPNRRVLLVSDRPR